MGVFQALKHVEFIVDHALVAFHVLLQDDLDGHLARGAVRLSDDAIGAGAERATEAVFRPKQRPSVSHVAHERGGFRGSALFVVAFGLAVQAVEHCCDWKRGREMSVSSAEQPKASRGGGWVDWRHQGTSPT